MSLEWTTTDAPVTILDRERLTDLDGDESYADAPDLIAVQLSSGSDEDGALIVGTPAQLALWAADIAAALARIARFREMGV